MSNIMQADSVKYIVARLIENAAEASEESRSDKKNEFAAGRKVAYYEMLDILKSELDANDQDLKEYGLNIDLVKTFA